MANVKITDLDPIPFSSITTDDVFPIVDVSGDVTYKISLNQLKTYVNSGNTDVFVTGGTYSSGNATFTNNTGGTFSVTGFSTASTFTGGTVTGATNFTAGLTANTISATTYQNLPISIIDVGVGTGSTYRVGNNNSANGDYSTVSGGRCNTSSNSCSTVSGGYLNTSSSYYSTISGGYRNTSSGYNSSVSGGYNNTSSCDGSTIGGGLSNESSDPASTVGGGIQNTSNGTASTIGGGICNTSSGCHSTVSGGRQNIAGINGTVSGSNNYTYTGGTFNGTYGPYSPTSTNTGDGIGATFTFFFDGANTLTTVNIITIGSGYVNGDTLLFDGSLFGGTPITDDVTIQINTVSLGNYSTVSGGRNNTSSGNYSMILGGNSNTTIGIRSAVVGGQNIIATDDDMVYMANANIQSSGYIYFGDVNTDGSWRMRISGSTFIIEKRVGGSWVTSGTFV